MFRRLSTRLTVLYGGLFSLVLLVLIAASYVAVIDYAKSSVQKEMGAATSVFQRLWALKAEALETNAVLLSRDFGFKSAIADGDIPTVDSAFDNLKARLNADEGAIVGADGTMLSSQTSVLSTDMSKLLMQTYNYEPATGIVTIGKTAYSTVTAPILAPDPIGWIVFAERLDPAEMRNLEALTAIGLKASVLTRSVDGQWRTTSGGPDILSANGLKTFVDQQTTSKGAEIIRTRQGQMIAVATAMPSLDPQQQAVLMLTYPLNAALKAYQPLLMILFGLGIVALGVIVVASLYLARSITRPMRALQNAASRLTSGETELVVVDTRDEMADLATAFNSMVVSIRDREARILHLARHDVTTDLPNRTAFEEHIAAKVAGGAMMMVFAVGIERYSHIRAVWGVPVANEAMSAMAEVAEMVAPGIFISRLGPDSLGIGASAEQGAVNAEENFAAVLSQILNGRFNVGDRLIDISVTIGYDAIGPQTLNAVERTERALIALDQARQRKLDCSAFDPKTYDELADNLLLTEQLREALNADGLEVYYQPKYNYRTGRVDAAEALVRWIHPQRGFVSPQRFVLIAEETGYIRQLTLLVLARTIRDQAALKRLGFDVAISVNYSGRLLSDDEFTHKTLDMCATAKGMICLEITETAVIEDPKIGLAAVERFVAAGIEISIDDFGTGLSSLSYLKLIPAQELKIDRSFVMEMEKTKRDALLVRATIDMAHGLGMKVTAEGVEEQSTLAALALMGCDMAQGYGIAKPMPFKDFKAYLSDAERQPHVDSNRAKVS